MSTPGDGETGSAKPVSPPALVGAWRLVSREYRTEDGHPAADPDRAVEGLLLYGAGGWMSAQIMRPDRPRFASGDRGEATDEEIRAAYQGYLAYWGRWTVDVAAGTITHHVVGSLFPNWVGQAQVRAFTLDGSRLILRTPPIRQRGRHVSGILTWERIPEADAAGGPAVG